MSWHAGRRHLPLENACTNAIARRSRLTRFQIHRRARRKSSQSRTYSSAQAVTRMTERVANREAARRLSKRESESLFSDVRVR
jgi:hypothetical protein